MDFKQALIDIEKELDKKAESLTVWETSFQNIISQILLGIDAVVKMKGIEIAIDHCSRLSYVFELIKRKSAKGKITSTTEAILSIDTKYIDDIKFLIAYAHFCMLMPQIHRGYLVPVKIEDKFIKIDYSSPETEYAELIDRLYAYISLQVAVSFKEEKQLDEYLNQKALNHDTTFSGSDAMWVKKLYEYFKTYSINVEVLPSDVLRDGIGLDYNEYISFTSTIKAFSYYWLRLGYRYYDHAMLVKGTSADLADQLMSEYFEFMVNCHDFKFVGFYMTISGLSKEKVISGISHYLSIYTNNTGEPFSEKAYCGEGFLPPFILFDKHIISSVYASFYMLNLNNVLYSINKMQPKLFDEKISQHLEPTLINQLVYLFSSLHGVSTRKNVNYSKGELDLLVLSEVDNTCLVIQVKATIAPDSSRSVDRVQTRALEGIGQVNTFRETSMNEKLKIVNDSFGISFTNLSFIDILVVRSCAGSELIWKKNDEVRIANYTLLASIIANKLKANDNSIAHFDDSIKSAQEELIKKSSFKKEYQNLQIGEYTLRFPNIETDLSAVVSLNFRLYEFLPDFERSHS
jgi:hypothetical protein